MKEIKELTEKENKIKEIVISELKRGNTSARSMAQKACDKYGYNFWGTRTQVRRMLGVSQENRLYEKYNDIKDLYSQISGDQYSTARARVLKRKKVYIFSCALNETPIHERLWENILAYANYHNAEIGIIPIRYKNPTSVFSDIGHENWDERVVPYLDANRHTIGDFLTVLSDVKVVPTNVDPLFGLNSMTGHRSFVVGHPRIAMQFESVLHGQPEKQMLSTGCVTLKNYTNSSLGVRAEHHHSYGFAIVEVRDDSGFHMRSVSAKSDGSFIDLKFHVADGKVNKVEDGVEAIAFGDIHGDKLTVDSLTRMLYSMFIFKPKSIILHDLFDGSTVNPHEQKNIERQVDLVRRGRFSVAQEINATLEIIKLLKKSDDLKIIIVKSNHDKFLDRWIRDTDFKKDPINAHTYLIYAQKLISGEAKDGLFNYIVGSVFPSDNVICLKQDESYMIKNIEVGVHGDVGCNGARGNVSQFKKLSTKMVTGHTHSPSIRDGVYTVGTQEKEHGYNVGASNWAVSDVLIHSNGKRQHIVYHNNNFTTFDI